MRFHWLQLCCVTAPSSQTKRPLLLPGIEARHANQTRKCGTGSRAHTRCSSFSTFSPCSRLDAVHPEREVVGTSRTSPDCSPHFSFLCWTPACASLLVFLTSLIRVGKGLWDDVRRCINTDWLISVFEDSLVLLKCVYMSQSISVFQRDGK